MSIYQNLMTHNSRRNPRLDCELPVEVINNVIYNSGGAPWGIHQPIVVADDTLIVVDGKTKADNIAGKYDFINNYFKPGPSTGSTVESYVGPPRHFIGDLPDLKNPDTRIYAKGNYLPKGTAELRGTISGTRYEAKNPTNDTQVPVFGAIDAYNKVLDYVGDCYRLNSDGSRTFRRDELDTRWVNDVKNTTGEWVNVPRDLPPHTKGEVNKDSDDDGMPDDYEDRFAFLNKNDPDDGSEDEDGDGVTNVEEFLFGTSPGEVVADAPCNDKPSAGTYQLVARHSGKVLDVSGISKNNGANVHQWEYVGGANQHWQITPVGNGYYTLKAKHSGLALAVDLNPATNGGLNSTFKGVNIFQYGTNQDDNRLWKIEPVGNCYYKLTNKHSSQVLDVSGVSEANGANVQQWSYGEGENQQWKLVPVEANARVAAAPSKSEVNALPQSAFSAYPNPAAEQLTVQGGKDYQVTLYDLSGQRVLRQKHLKGQTQVDISHLRPGVYILKMRDREQHELRQRVMIE